MLRMTWRGVFSIIKINNISYLYLFIKSIYHQAMEVIGRGLPKPAPFPPSPAFMEQNPRASRLIL